MEAVNNINSMLSEVEEYLQNSQAHSQNNNKHSKYIQETIGFEIINEDEYSDLVK